MNIFKFIWRPLNLYKRDREFYKRHAAGPLSSRDIIAIEYGAFPPKGWNANEKPFHHTPVDIYTPLTDKKSTLLGRLLSTAMTLGYVKPGKPPKNDISETPPAEKQSGLALNKFIFSPLGQAGVIHIAHSLITRIAPVILTMNPLAIFNQAPLLFLMALTSLRNQPLTQIFTLPFRPAMDTIGHENIHVLQERDPYETRTGYNMFRNAFKKSADRVIETSALHKNIRGANNLLSFGLAGYFRNDYEIQARLNTLLTHNYARWGVLPQTKHQLWAALIDAGLRAPAEIHAELKNSNEELSPFYKPDLTSTFNRAAKQITTVHVAELNTAYWGLISADLKKDYWHNTLPYIYGHLAELCGDQAGLARMGYTGPVHKECGALPADPAQRKIFWDRLTGKHSDTIKKHYAELETVEENGLSAIFADGTEIHLDDLDECIDFMREIARLKNLEAQRDLWIVDEPHIEAAARSIKQDTITRTLQSHSARTYPVAVDLKNRFAAPIPPVL